jgi:hypothetical protein
MAIGPVIGSAASSGSTRSLGPSRVNLLGVTVFGIAVVLIAAALTQTFLRAGVHGWDAQTYLAAGERLNAGHPLYALSPGDRPVMLRPPYWTAPLLSPPLIAVIWRPLAALPSETGIAVWWITSIAIILVTVAAAARRAILPAGLALLILFPSFVGELEVANVNGYLLGGTVLAWLLARRGNDVTAGGLIALMAAMKLWPVVLLVWFIGQRRWGALRGFVVGGAVVAVVSVVGAGIGAHSDYLAIASSTPPSALSAAGILTAFGVNVPWIGYVILAFGVSEVLALRNRPELAFSVAVATMIIGSPVMNPNTFMVLYACIAPLAWRLDQAPEVVPGLERLGSPEARRA